MDRSISQLQQASVISLSDWFAIAQDGVSVSKKASLDQMRSIFGAVGVSGIASDIPDTSFVPPASPPGTIVYFMGPGTYPNFPTGSGDLVLTEALNAVTWDGTIASALPIPVNVDISGQLAAATTSDVFVNVNTDTDLDIRSLLLSGTDHGRKYFLGNFQNYFNNTANEYWVRIEIKDDLGNIVARLNSESATQVLTGVERLLIPGFGGSGVRAELLMNFDSSFGTELTDFNYELKASVIGSNEAFSNDSISIIWGIERVLCDNPASLGEPIYLRAFRNVSSQTLIRIETASQIIAYLNEPATTPRTGREVLLVPEYQESGYNFILNINWDIVTQSLNHSTTTDYILSPIVDTTLGTSSDENPYPFVEGTDILDIIDIRDINPVSGDDLVDEFGFAKEFHVNRAYNWFDSTYGDYRALVQISDDANTVVAQIFETGLPGEKTGVQTETLGAIGSGTTDWTIIINWDALAGSTTGFGDIGYVIDERIIYRRVDLSSGSGEVTVYEPIETNGAKTYRAIDLCTNYLSKLLGRTEDVNILLLGDSLTARTASISQLADPSAMPPWMVAESWPKHLFDRYVMNKPFYQRFDSGAFAETGAFTDSFDIFEGTGGVPQWSRPSRQEGNRSRYSTDSGAAVSLSWNLDAYEKMNFVHDLDYRAAQQVTVAVASGNGSVEVWSGSSWVEANGYQFSQWIDDAVATDGSGHALSVNKVRMKFRRAIAATGTVTISFTKDGTADYFFYWGTEMWNGATVHIHNAARGGHETAELRKSLLDLEYYNPDLIIFELPLINEINQFGSGEAIVNHQWDFIWGDRPGNETDSLKSTYPNANIVAVVPHIDKENWSGDLPVIGQAGTLNDASGLDVIERCKALFLGRVDVQYIDVFNEMVQIAKINGWTIEQAFTGAPATSKASFNRDSSHQNDYGHRVWASVVINNMKL